MTQEPSRRAYDLTALTSELNDLRNKGHLSFEKYRIAINLYAASASIHRDLLSSMRSLETLGDVAAQDEARQVLGQALFTHAVLCYCRAVVSRMAGRSRINVEKLAYDGDLLAKHIAIKELRSTALAHYHGGTSFGDIWSDDRVIARHSNGKIFSSDPHVIINFSREATTALFDLLEVAIPYVWKEKLRRRYVLDELLVHALAEDAAFVSRMEAHLFDPNAFFEGAMDEQSFWSGTDEKIETYT